MAAYRSGRTLALAATLGIAAAASTQAFVAGARAYVAVFARESEVGYELSAGLGSLLNVAVFCSAGVVFLFWLRRAVANTLALGSTVRLTTLDAVIWWFVPIVSILKPYSVVSSVYQANTVPERVPGDWVARAPMLLPLWWGSWLVMIISRVLGAPQDNSFRTRETATTWAAVAGVPFAFVAALTAMAVIWSIEHRLAARARGSTAPRPVFEPPPSMRRPEADERDDEDDTAD
ncbi:MAG TPA: DUF4328 domain-containing protein [Polyangiaceae bacterium]|nr:DUF4328 domain-containing protein [Polyangiaceae bacterium]